MAIKRKYIFICLLVVLPQVLLAQFHNASGKHSCAAWVSGGYDRLNNFAVDTRAVGGGGFAFGAGYEYWEKFGFILQSGVEFSYGISNLSRTDTMQVVDMIDTEGDQYDGIFSFNKINDRQSLWNVGFTFMPGYKSRKGIYVLAGIKIGLNMATTSVASSEVVSEARYKGLIGEDDNGLFGDMPNHFLTTTTRSQKKPLSIMPSFTGSVECGYIFVNKKNRRDPNTFRLALFCDYGIMPVGQNNTTYDLIINNAVNGEYLPQINNYLYYGAKSVLSNVYCGVKVTFVHNLKPRHKCIGCK